MSDANKIYSALFKEPILPSLEDKYRKAFEALSSGFSEAHVEEYRAAVEGPFDIEALEMAGRFRKRLPLLVQAFNIMVYLAETVPDNQSEYVNFKTRTCLGFLSMAYGLCRSAGKLVKGLFLLRKIKDV
ncbi:hypothetical protein ACFLRX_09955 [Acidobacteriota bacterium]